MQGEPPVVVGPGDVYVVGPNVAWSRRIVGEGDWVAMSVTFTARPHWIPWLRFLERGRGLPVVHMADPKLRRRVIRRFREMMRLYERADPLFREEILHRTESVILLMQRQCALDNVRPMDERIVVAIEVIRSNLRRSIRVEELAERCYMSRSRFAELFREQVGHPPAAFANVCRIDRAKDLLLLTHDPVAVIAAEVGLDDAKHFARLFQQHTGLSPTRFRRERRPARSERTG